MKRNHSEENTNGEQFFTDQEEESNFNHSEEKELIDEIHGIFIRDQEEVEKILSKLNNDGDEGDDFVGSLRSMQEDMIVLKVGNVDFYTCRNTIKDIAEFQVSDMKERNPQVFEYILEYLRIRRVDLIGIEKLNYDLLRELSREAQFFKLNELMEYISGLLVKYHLYECDIVEKDKTVRDRIVNPEKIQQSIREMNSQMEKARESSLMLAKQLFEKYHDFINCGVGESSVTVNVSGQLFLIPFSCLAKFETFLITKYIQSPNFKLNNRGQIFIDRNPDLFKLFHGYLISYGKFNHFPRNISNERKYQLFREAKFYGLESMTRCYVDVCRYPIELLSTENVRLKEREDKLRELFVKDRQNDLLKDPYLFLSPLFEIKDVIQSKEKFKINFADCPKLLNLSDITKYSKQTPKTTLVANLETFKNNFSNLTKKLLEGLDWTGIFVAGGSVLGCCLKEIPDEDQPLIAQPAIHKLKMEHPRYHHYKEDEEFNDSDNFSVVGGSFRENFFYSNNPLLRLEFFNCKTFKSDTLPTKTIDTVPNAREVLDPEIPHSFKKSDIDLFLYAMTEEEAELKIKHIYQVIKQNLSILISSDTGAVRTNMSNHRGYLPGKDHKIIGATQIGEASEKFINDDILIVRTKYAVTFYMYRLPPIQIVLRIYKSPAEILFGFDVDSCTLGFDGSIVWCSDRAIRALSHRTNLVDVDRQSTTYTYRLFKYAKRGFSVSVPGYHHSLVKNQYLHYPRRVACSKLKDKLEGLAKLLLYDFACRSRNPKLLLRSYYEDDSLRSKQLELSKELSEKKSDYLDLTILKYDRKTPKMLDEILQSQKSRLRFLIHSLNDLDFILNTNDSLNYSDVSNRIQWIVIEPTTQRVGSFNPITRNFYHDAYHPVQPKDLLLLDDVLFPRKLLQIQQWCKTVRKEDLEKPGTSTVDIELYDKNRTERYLHKYSDQKSQLYTELYPPEISNKIEMLYREFLFLGKPVEVEISPYERINFITSQVLYSSDHPLYPNSSDFLFRKRLKVKEPLDYEILREKEQLPEDCQIAMGLCWKSFY